LLPITVAITIATIATIAAAAVAVIRPVCVRPIPPHGSGTQAGPLILLIRLCEGSVLGTRNLAWWATR
jgi:hypothetical protein